MKKIALISSLVLVTFLFLCQGLYAQRSYRYNPGVDEEYFDLNLTQAQMSQIDRLELELEKEISPLLLKLRAKYIELDELEMQRNADPDKLEKAWETVTQLEQEIEAKELAHEKKIRDLLTEEQKVLYDAYFRTGPDPNGRGYYGPLTRGYGGYGYGMGRGRIGMGRGLGRLGFGNSGYGRGLSRGYGVNQRYYGRGLGRLQGLTGRGYYPRYRLGRGPCGMGLGRWYRMGNGRGRWIWEE